MNFYLSEKKIIELCGFAFLSASDHHQSLTNESRHSFTFKSINLSITCQTKTKLQYLGQKFRFIHPFIFILHKWSKSNSPFQEAVKFSSHIGTYVGTFYMPKSFMKSIFITQCWKFRIFLSLRFYVKSILQNLEDQKLPIL